MKSGNPLLWLEPPRLYVVLLVVGAILLLCGR
jgi:hypothetical protein